MDEEIIDLSSDDDVRVQQIAENLNMDKKMDTEIKKKITEKREILRSNSIRTPLLIMAEEAVNSYNNSHPDSPQISITQELLRTLSTKFWDYESQARSSAKAIHEMERVNIDELTVPILKSIEEKGKLMEFEREKLADSSKAGPSQQRGKKRKLEDQFHQILPNVPSAQITISVNSSGHVDVYYVENVEKKRTHICKTPYTATSLKRIGFPLPENLVTDDNLKNLNAFYSDCNLEIILNTKKTLVNGKLIPITITE